MGKKCCNSISEKNRIINILNKIELCQKIQMCGEKADRLQTLITTTIPFFLPFNVLGIFGFLWDIMGVSSAL